MSLTINRDGNMVWAKEIVELFELIVDFQMKSISSQSLMSTGIIIRVFRRAFSPGWM